MVLQDVYKNIDKLPVAFNTDTLDFFLFTRTGERMFAKSFKVLKRKYQLAEKIVEIEFGLDGVKSKLFEEDYAEWETDTLKDLRNKLKAIEKAVQELPTV